jgi:hypothetical protein
VKNTEQEIYGKSHNKSTRNLDSKLQKSASGIQVDKGSDTDMVCPSIKIETFNGECLDVEKNSILLDINGCLAFGDGESKADSIRSNKKRLGYNNSTKESCAMKTCSNNIDNFDDTDKELVKHEAQTKNFQNDNLITESVNIDTGNHDDCFSKGKCSLPKGEKRSLKNKDCSQHATSKNMKQEDKTIIDSSSFNQIQNMDCSDEYFCDSDDELLAQLICSDDKEKVLCEGSKYSLSNNKNEPGKITDIVDKEALFQNDLVTCQNTDLTAKFPEAIQRNKSQYIQSTSCKYTISASKQDNVNSIKATKQQDIGAYFGLKPLLKTSDETIQGATLSELASLPKRHKQNWYGKRQQNSEVASKMNGQTMQTSDASESESSVNLDWDDGYRSKKCPFYKKIPGNCFLINVTMKKFKLL